MKQELEFQTLQLENDREELLERTKDDQIKILHDERLKVRETCWKSKSSLQK